MRHDFAWFKQTLKQLIWDNFDLMPNKELEPKNTSADVDPDEESKMPT